jgi:hypothetical protein
MNWKRTSEMKCEEFEAIGLGLDREGPFLTAVGSMEHAAILDHANSCARCAALFDSWQEAQSALRELRLATQAAQTPLRVEMRLRQEFRAAHRTVRTRTTAVVAAWTLAAAAVLVGAVSWHNWRQAQQHGGVAQNSGSVGGNDLNVVHSTDTGSVRKGSRSQTTLVAGNAAEDFTLFPGSLAQETENAAIVRVRMQRGALGALGLPVNEERSGEWIQVDLLVGDDGQPQAVRLAQ